jgi:hypothetical protein
MLTLRAVARPAVRAADLPNEVLFSNHILDHLAKRRCFVFSHKARCPARNGSAAYQIACAFSPVNPASSKLGIFPLALRIVSAGGSVRIFVCFEASGLNRFFPAAIFPKGFARSRNDERNLNEADAS